MIELDFIEIQIEVTEVWKSAVSIHQMESRHRQAKALLRLDFTLSSAAQNPCHLLHICFKK